MSLFARRSLGLIVSVVAVVGACAKASVNQNASGGGGNGNGGTAGTSQVPYDPLPGLTSIAIAPATQNVTLTGDPSAMLTGQATYTATGMFMDGHSEDVTTKVLWTAPYFALNVAQGQVTVHAPGSFTIEAQSGTTIKATAQLVATYQGTFSAQGFSAANSATLDGASPAAGISIAYPSSGALFPGNFGPITVQIAKSGTQDIARLAFTGDGIDLKLYAPCETGPGGGCYVTLPVAVTSLLVGPSADHNIKFTARLASSTGGSLAETPAIEVAWTPITISGGLYYWTTISANAYTNYKPAAGQATGTGIMRYNFDGNASAPELVYTDQGTPPDFKGSPPAQDYSQCIGCHAITQDGRLMAFSVGGSSTSSLAMLDIQAKQLWELDPTASAANAVGIEALKRDRKLDTATFTTFGPMSDLMVNMYRGVLTLRAVNMSLTAQGAILTKVSDLKTDPFWSADGATFAFTTFNPALSKGNYNTDGLNGDMKVGGQIWVATADQTGIHDDAQVVVPHMDGFTNFYPAISPDSQLMVFNRSTCGAGTMDPTKASSDYGNGPCDGYDDMTATLWLTTPKAGAPALKLTNANGGDGTGDKLSNSWPRWSPDFGPFRGGTLYWIAFSSRRPYGLQVNTGAPATTKPQLWFAAVIVGGEFQGDPSFPPIWLPNQNPNQESPFGNHVPQWVRVAVPLK